MMRKSYLAPMILASLAACSTAPPVVVQIPPVPPVDVRAECEPPELYETDALQLAYTLAAAFGKCRSAALFLDGAWRGYAGAGE